MIAVGFPATMADLEDESSGQSVPSPTPWYPTWKEMADHNRALSEDLRKTISLWFQIAAGLLGIFALIAAFFVGKTWSEVEKNAQETATHVAESTAKKAVEEYFKNPDKVRIDIAEEVRKYLASDAGRGAIHKEVDTAVPKAVSDAIAVELAKQIPTALKSYRIEHRLISEAAAARFRRRAANFQGRSVVIRCARTFLDEQTKSCLAAIELRDLLSGSGLSASVVWDPNTSNPFKAKGLYYADSDTSDLVSALTELLESTGGRRLESVKLAKSDTLLANLPYEPRMLVTLMDMP